MKKNSKEFYRQSYGAREETCKKKNRISCARDISRGHEIPSRAHATRLLFLAYNKISGISCAGDISRAHEIYRVTTVTLLFITKNSVY